MPVTFKPYLKAYKDKSGLQQVVIRITMDRKSRYADTGFRATAKQFNANPKKEGLYAQSTHPEAGDVNTKIQEMIQTGKDWHKHHPDAELEEMVQVLEGNAPERELVKSANGKSFLAFAAQHLVYIEANYPYNTYSNYRTAIHHVRVFQKQEDLQFDQIDLTWTKRFQAYLLSRPTKDEDARVRSSKLVVLLVSRMLRAAMEDQVIPIAANPFEFVRWKKTKKRRIPLDEEEIERLESVVLKEGSPLFRARNIFLFQFYLAGMRISDIILLRWDHISGDRLDYMMKKNQRDMTFPLVEKARKILAYYHQFATGNSGFVFPILKEGVNYSDKTFRDKKIQNATKNINKTLAKLKELTGINKHITTHIARHTFGHIAALRGLTSYDLRDCFGHSSTSITDTYTGQFSQDRMDKSLRKVIEN